MTQIQLVTPLLWGIDKLEGSFDCDGYMEATELLRTMQQLKAEAQADRQAVTYQLGHRTFLVSPRGRPFYPFCLQHADMTVWLMEDEQDGTPPVLLSLSSEFLWAVGPKRAVKDAYVTLRLMGLSPTADHCSRVDPMLDWTGRRLRLPDQYDITCSSRKRALLDDNFLVPDEYVGYVGQRLRDEREGVATEEGLEIRRYGIQRGRRTELTGLGIAYGQPLMCRLYNKVLEIERVSGKRWFYDLWQKNGWAPDPDTGEVPVVWRTEFQLRRKALTDLAPLLDSKLDSFADVIDSLPALWKWLTWEWLTFRDRRADSNVTRCPVRRWWREIQAPQIGVDWDDLDPVERLGRLRRAKRRVLDAQIAGCLAGVAAYMGTPGDMAESVLQWVGTLDQTLAPNGAVAAMAEGWGRRARKRVMDYLVADLRDRLKEALQVDDVELPDLVAVILHWKEQLPPELAERFKTRSMTAMGQVNGGRSDVEGASDWSSGGGSGTALHELGPAGVSGAPGV